MRTHTASKSAIRLSIGTGTRVTPAPAGNGPDLMAAAIQKRDIAAWAASHDIVTSHGDDPAPACTSECRPAAPTRRRP